MRILVATSHRGIVGGTETYLRAVLPLLVERGHAIGLLTDHPASGARIDELCPGLPSWRSVRDMIGWEPQVCYLHGLTNPADEAALADRFPTAYYAHGFGGMCVSGTKVCGGRPCSRPLGVGCLARYFPQRCGGTNLVTMWRQYGENRRRRATFARYRTILAASRAMADELVRNAAPTDRVRVLPLFPPSTVPDAEPPAPREFSGRVLFSGRLIAMKGWRHLIPAVAHAVKSLTRPLTLVVAGDGPDAERFRADAAKSDLAVEFLGWIDPARREAETRRADLLLFPSLWPEPFGLSGIEAGCVGLPAAGYAVGGVPDWLEPGVSGESAPGDAPNPVALGEAISRALADRDHWQRLRTGAWATAQRFTPDAHLRLLLEELEAIRRT